MPSPFPGMNPYLEQSDSWEDFHQNYMTRIQEALTPLVGPGYFVKIEVRLYLHELSAEERHYFGRGDAAITRPPGPESSASSPISAAAPMRLSLPNVDIERHSSIEIRDRRNRRVVTVIELLSPTNKTPGPDRDEYLAKRARLLTSPTHLVEIDLRRGDERPRPPELPACDYYVLVSRARERPDPGFWPISLRERLPIIPIPLAAPDPDVQLDLQTVLNRVYDAADYGKYIYGETPQPPLSEADAAWALQLIS